MELQTGLHSLKGFGWDLDLAALTQLGLPMVQKTAGHSLLVCHWDQNWVASLRSVARMPHASVSLLEYRTVPMTLLVHRMEQRTGLHSLMGSH